MKTNKNNIVSINNSIVDGKKHELVKMKEEKKMVKSKGYIGVPHIDAILEYGYETMAETGKNWFIYDLPISLISIDTTYQRNIDDRIVRSIIRNYNPNRLDVKLVNFRFDQNGDGKFWILDGQHTLTVERMMGHETLTCKVFIGSSQKDEAMLFSKQNEFRRSITAFAQFKAECVAEMSPAVDIKNLCDKYHIEIKQAYSIVPANTITSVRRLYTIVKKGGIEALDFTIQALIELGWNKVEGGMNEKVLGLFVAYEFCKGQKRNYNRLMGTLRAFKTPQNMVDFAVSKYREEAKSEVKCVEMFIKSIF